MDYITMQETLKRVKLLDELNKDEIMGDVQTLIDNVKVTQEKVIVFNASSISNGLSIGPVTFPYNGILNKVVISCENNPTNQLLVTLYRSSKDAYISGSDYSNIGQYALMSGERRLEVTANINVTKDDYFKVVIEDTLNSSKFSLELVIELGGV